MNRVSTAIIATALLTVAGPVLTGPFAIEGQSPGAAPAAPVVLSSVKMTTVVLVWNVVPGATGFRVDGGTAPGSTTMSNTLGRVPTSFVTTLSPGTYYFRVYAFNGSGISPPSDEVTVVVGDRATPPPSAPTTPPAPTGATAVVSGTTVTLSWSLPVGSTAFLEVWQGSSGRGEPSSRLFAGSVGAVNAVSGTVPPGNYLVHVSAVNAAGQSPPAVTPFSVEGTTGGGGGCSSAPASPTGVAFTVTGNLVSVRWNSGDRCPGTTYILHAGSAPGLSNVAIANVGTALSISASAPGGTYYVRIFAQNAFGLSAPSGEVIITVGGISPSPPPPPTGSTDALFNQAVVLYNAGRIPEARALFAQVTVLDSGRAEAHYWVGIIDLNSGDLAGAARGLRQYLALAPSGQYAANATAILTKLSALGY